MSVVVELSRDEMMWAAQGGCLRYIDAQLKRRQENFSHWDPWGRDILGCLAECAVAKYKNAYWTPCHDRPHGVADLGTDKQVRSSPNPRSPLTIYKTDKSDHSFLLVITQPPKFTLVGWMHGKDAKQPQYWKDTNVNAPAFFVPQADLRPLKAEASPLQEAA